MDDGAGLESASGRARPDVRSAEVALWSVAIVIASFVVPFIGGTLLAVILDVTRFRRATAVVKWSLVAVGVATGIVLAISFYGPTTTSLHVGPPVVVSN